MKRIVFIFFCVLLTTTSCRWIEDADDTVFDNYKPSELLRKYEWFKDASAQADQKMATLNSYASRFNEMKKAYGADSATRSKWSRSDV